MYSFESSLSSRNTIDRKEKILLVSEESFDQKKRKLEPKSDKVLNLHWSEESKSLKETTKEVAKVDVELHLETPLPADWKQCNLDFQSRQNHFCNTTTRRRASQYRTRQSWDIFANPPQSSISRSAPVSLELELNLPDGSSRAAKTSTFGTQCCTPIENERTGGIISTAKSLSWVCLTKDEEMLATVCMRCHMLVMLCKSSPCCPNCKFMHIPAPNPPLNLLNLVSDNLGPLDRSTTLSSNNHFTRIT